MGQAPPVLYVDGAEQAVGAGDQILLAGMRPAATAHLPRYALRKLVLLPRPEGEAAGRLRRHLLCNCTTFCNQVILTTSTLSASEMPAPLSTAHLFCHAVRLHILVRFHCSMHAWQVRFHACMAISARPRWVCVADDSCLIRLWSNWAA